MDEAYQLECVIEECYTQAEQDGILDKLELPFEITSSENKTGYLVIKELSKQRQLVYVLTNRKDSKNKPIEDFNVTGINMISRALIGTFQNLTPNNYRKIWDTAIESGLSSSES